MATPKVGQYFYCLHRNTFVIHQYTDIYDNGYSAQPAVGEKAYQIYEREEARKRVYELNGWTYKPR